MISSAWQRLNERVMEQVSVCAAIEAHSRLISDQLRARARHLMSDERSNHTLQATALVNEACIKILREGVLDDSDNRRQLFHAAIRAMRRDLLVDDLKMRWLTRSQKSVRTQHVQFGMV